ncbi:PIN2/TERF1-interacting telomerase inhibitor 1-like [Limulus polyphemus]|uniref:PIN2/TERF1-interacting telomerase inhibitor 1-like n=1 Tax=Limulus polyphemus TaxID=6850 RepID=A0ABM1B2N2_LIMPO|nr:PIN2/TERF1-interacting telomerase inhibitor 1-like [Limulus polyphemus]
MSMLAEPKRKVVWSLDPRGKLWSEDNSKFGQKLLEKMGWKKGKGLGKNEDGNPEHIKVSYKNDSTGIGYKGYDDTWITYQSDFNSLLANLNGSECNSSTSFPDSIDTNNQFPSLELKSKKSRKRVQ